MVSRGETRQWMKRKDQKMRLLFESYKDAKDFAHVILCIIV